VKVILSRKGFDGTSGGMATVASKGEIKPSNIFDPAVTGLFFSMTLSSNATVPLPVIL